MYNEISDLITIDELCDVLSIGRKAAYKLLNNKTIPAFRIGRVWKIPKDFYKIKQKICSDLYCLDRSRLDRNQFLNNAGKA